MRPRFSVRPGASSGPTGVDVQAGGLRHRSRAIQAWFESKRLRLRYWLAEPGNVRRLARVAVPLLVVSGLLLPPVSLLSRWQNRHFAVVPPGTRAVVASQPIGAWLEVRGESLSSPSRWRVRVQEKLPRPARRLPEGYELASRIYVLGMRGEAPDRASLEIAFRGSEATAPLTDAFGWDGSRWRWLPLRLLAQDRASVELRPRRFTPQLVILAIAGPHATEVSAVLLEPPALVPAAAAELSILELRAYHLADQEGTIRGKAFGVPSRQARLYGVLDDREGSRRRPDLVHNLLVSRSARQRHRQAIVEIVRRDGLSGVVIEYDGVTSELQPVYAEWLGRLASDLHRHGAELVVSLPAPARRVQTWDAAPYDWVAIGQAADAVRIRLPDAPPLAIADLDSLVRWAFGSVPRYRLQLSVPAMGRDVVDGTVQPIAFSDALARILDMAQADAACWARPGTPIKMELPLLRAAQLGRELDTGQWRFYWWDGNRRRHTIWLNDAAALKPAFEVAQRYRLGRIVLDGFTTGIDPNLWRMASTFQRHGVAATTVDRYILTWQLVNDRAEVVQTIEQPLDQPWLDFLAPTTEGEYRMVMSLSGVDGRILVSGASANLTVSRAAEPTPTLPVMVYKILPTAETVATAPPPPDEARLQRTPVRVRTAGTPTVVADFDAISLYPKGELRAAPSFDAERISDLRPGEVMTVLGRTADSQWLQVVLLATGLQGWLRVELVELKKPLASLPVIIVTPSPAR